MSSQGPLVSICIPNFNKARYIRETFLSIFNQTYRNIEIIVIDDHSSDNSPDIIRELIGESPFPVFFSINSENRGVSWCSHRGVTEAKGKYFQVLSSDDIILPDKIDRQVDIMENANKNVAFVYGHIRVIDEDGLPLQKDYFTDIGFGQSIPPSGNIYRDLLRLNFIPALSSLIKTSCLIKAGNYDVTLRSEDWDIFLRLTANYEAIYDDVTCALYRIEQNSLMRSDSNKGPVFSSFCKALIKHLGKSKTNDRIIYNNIKKFAAIIYSFDGNESRFWLRMAVKHNFSFKNFIYLIGAHTGIKYSYYKKRKAGLRMIL